MTAGIAAEHSRLAVPALLLAVFIISASFGLVLPQAPVLATAAGAGDDVPLHTGALTALYMLAITIFAPLWGRLSDRRGRRPVLIVGLIGFALSTGFFALVTNLPQLYLERFTSGLFAAAVSPVAAAYVADISPSKQWRASRLAWLNMASIAGFVLGPLLSVGATLLIDPGGSNAARPMMAPFAIAGSLALIAAGLVAFSMRPGLQARPDMTNEPAQNGRALAATLLALSFATALIVGAFEVILSLRSGRMAQLTSAELAAMFAACSVVMFTAQAVLFSPLVRAGGTWRILVPGFVTLAIALVLASQVETFIPAVAVVSLVAAAAGVISPILAYWLSMSAGKRQGAQLGKQAAAMSLGQAMGSAAGGILLGELGAAAALLLAAGLAAAAAIGAWLVSPRLEQFAHDRGAVLPAAAPSPPPRDSL